MHNIRQYINLNYINMDYLPNTKQNDCITPQYCPITLERCVKPVIADDGYIYEEAAIRECQARYGISPITRMPISNKFVPTSIIYN